MTGMVCHVCLHLCLAMEDTAAVCCNNTCLLLCQYDRFLCGKCTSSRAKTCLFNYIILSTSVSHALHLSSRNRAKSTFQLKVRWNNLVTFAYPISFWNSSNWPTTALLMPPFKRNFIMSTILAATSTPPSSSRAQLTFVHSLGIPRRQWTPVETTLAI